MSGVDDRVVQLKFDNKQFESASAQSMSTLDKLKKSLDFSASTKSMGGLQKTAGSLNFGSIATQIEGISTKFLAMGTIGVTALVQISQQALATGAQMAKALTIDPVQQGFAEYSTNLNSIQTILANTQASGAKLKDVNATLAELNTYSDKTIYNFSEMARNIGTFTAAGVGLKPATAAIKGIANLAALSGSNSMQASTAMYQLSQAIAAGRVSLMDWNSVVNAGMGGTVFQRALTQTAVKMGTIKESAVKLKGPMKNVTIAGMSFRESISDPKVGGWLTSGVLTKTLAHFTGDLTDAQLAAEGFSKAEIKAIQLQAKTAQAAATEVKTISQVFDVAKETAGSGWAQSWQIIFGDFGQAKKDMTALSNFINGIINENAAKRNALLAGWAKNGGRAAGIDALKNAMTALSGVLDPIKKAWAAVFPATTGKQLAETTKAVRDFFKSLIIGQDTANKIGYVFKGLFTIFKIGKDILSGLAGFFVDMFKIFTAGADEAGGGLLDMAWNVSNLIQRFEYFLTSTNAIPAFFNRLYNAVGPTVAKIRDFVKSIQEVLGSGISQLISSLHDMGKAATTAGDDGVSPLAEKWQAFAAFFKGIPDLITSVIDAIKGAMHGIGSSTPDIGTSIMDNLEKINWVNVFKATLGTAFVATVGLWIKGVWNFIQAFKSFFEVGSSISGAFDQLRDTLKSYQKEIKARTLLLIAGAILALAVAIKILAGIPIDQLVVSVAVIYIVFEMLDSAMKSLSKMGENSGVLKVPAVAAALLLLAGSMVIFALAIKLISMMDVGELAKGVLTIGLLLRMVEVFASDAAKAQADILKAGAGMLFIALALNVLAAAIFIYSRMDPSTIIKGLAAVIAIVGGIGLAMRAMPKEGQMAKAAAGLLIIAFAMNIMAFAIDKLGKMDFDQMKNGIGGLIVMMLAMVVALNLMKTALPGAFAMIIGAAALVLFGQAIQTLANIGFGSVILGILGIVIAMVAIAAAAFLLAPAAVPMAIFGAAMVVLGAGFFLLGVGALAFATAVGIIVSVLSLGMPILEDTINNFIKLIPLLAQAFYTFLVEFANAFTAAVPDMVNAVTVLIINILAAVEKLIPAFQKVFSAFVKAGLDTLASMSADFITSGVLFVRRLLDGIAQNLPSIIKSGTKIITTLITGIGKAASDIAIAAGVTMLNFMNAITTWINSNAEVMGQAGRDLAGAIINGFTGGMASRLGDALNGVGSFFGSVIDRARQVLDSHSPSKVFIAIGKDVTAGFVIGVAAGRQQVLDSMNGIVTAIKKAKDDSLSHIKDLQSKIKDLEKDKSLTASQKKKLAQYKAELKVAEAEQKKLAAAYKTVSIERKAQEKQLLDLGAQYDVVTKKLDDARKAYEDAVKQRDDYNKKVTDQYSTLPTLDATSSLDAYFDAIRTATQANLKFKATLEQLRALGLDDNQYKKFMEQGTEIQPFLDQLLAAGGNTITELNNIDTTLVDSASQLGKSASEALYQAGVDSAKGLVDGLEANLADITAKMKSIGKAIADEIKKELGIHSPSKVFKEIGKFVVHGLRDGIDDNSNVVDLAARRMGKNAVDSLKDSLSGLSDVVSSDIALNPTIAPVLDLDAFRKDAAGINDILQPSSITPSTSTSVANDISNKTAAQALLLQEQQLAATGTTLEYNQYNTSPKALSTAEIYRQTKNQISTAKGALKN